jgi:hypothetical protein
MTAVFCILMTLLGRPDREACLVFLLEHSPESDGSGEYLPLIEENIDLAIWAADTMPWGDIIPDSIFLSYVLPARVSQEPLVDWRPVFRDALVPVLQGVTTIEEATVAVGAWCDSITDYQPTQMRDQSPFVTWSSGIGRCEELTVFYMDALRSVGIPCRQVYTPWWTTCDSNHAWPEVWTEHGWVYADASTEEVNKLPAWFDDRVSKAALVVAIASGSLPHALYKRGSVSIINTTDSYAGTGTLVIGDDSTKVFVSLGNYGALRPFLVMDTDLREADLGEGVYFASWGWPVQGVLFDITQGEQTVIVPGDSPIPGTMRINLREGS